MFFTDNNNNFHIFRILKPESYNKNEIKDYLKEHVQELSFITAIEHEFSIDLFDIIDQPFYKYILKTFPAKLKQDFVIFLIVLSKELFAGGKNTNADNISDTDIFFMTVIIRKPDRFLTPVRF